MKLFKGRTVNNQPAAMWKAIYQECVKHLEFIVEVRQYDPHKEISIQQMKFFHGAVVPLFVKYNGDSPQCWENRLKIECGSKWFTPKIIKIDGHEYKIIPSKTNLKTTDFMEWLQNITDYGLTIGVIVPPPDPEWKDNKTEARQSNGRGYKSDMSVERKLITGQNPTGGRFLKDRKK